MCIVLIQRLKDYSFIIGNEIWWQYIGQNPVLTDFALFCIIAFIIHIHLCMLVLPVPDARHKASDPLWYQ